MTAAQEIELKFAVPADQAEAVWRAIAPEAKQGKTPGKTLVATYFDTEDRRLAAAGFGLRIRDDGKSKVQTLKGPAPIGFARIEYETPVSGPQIDLTVLADTPVGPMLDGAKLAPLFTVEVVRRKTVMTQGAARIEVCLDTGWVEAGGQRDAISEVELELLEGSPSALFALARRLTQKRGQMTLAFESKAARGFRLLDGGRSGPPVVTSGMDAGAAFTAIGEAALAQIVAAAAALEQEVTPKRVHELRVGLRRLRSARSTFKAMLAGRETDAVAAELKWLAGALNEMRDLDVLAESTANTDAAFHRVLETARSEAREHLATVVASPRRRALDLKVAAWLTVGGWRRSRFRVIRLVREQPITAFAAEALDRRLNKLDRKEDLEALAPEARHRQRIKVKKLRYAAEAFAPLFDGHPKRRKRMIAAVKAAQECLGELNDDVVGRAIAHRLVSRSGDAEAAFAAGAAFAPDPRREAKRLKAAQEAWDEMFDVAPFWR